MWIGFAALCAGIIHLALITSAPLPVAIILATLGGIECIWGLVTFVRSRILAPRIALFGALVPTLLWGTLVAAASASHNPSVASYLGFGAMATATVLGLFIAIALAVQFRKGTDFSQSTRQPNAPVYLVGVVAGGIVAALLITPALAATDAGKYAPPMSDMFGMHLGATSLTIKADH
jgi:hypothetical protein